METFTLGSSLLVTYGDDARLVVVKGCVYVAGVPHMPTTEHVIPQDKDVLVSGVEGSVITLTGHRERYWLQEVVPLTVLPRESRVYCVCSWNSDLALTCRNLHPNCQLVDMHYQSSTFLPSWLVGTAVQQFYQTSTHWSDSMVASIGRAIQREAGQTVIIHSHPSLLAALPVDALLPRLASLGVESVILEDCDKLYYHLRQLHIPCQKVNWPQVTDRPQPKPCQLFHLESLDVVGIFQSYHLPPITCLPLGCPRILKECYAYLETMDVTSVARGIYGITKHIPIWMFDKPVKQRHCVSAITSLIVVYRRGVFYLAGDPSSAYDIKTEVILVSATAADLSPTQC